MSHRVAPRVAPRRAWLLALAALGVLSTGVRAQGGAPAPPRPRITAAGRVLLPHARDTVAVAGARVLLHRVGRDSQGPVDSTLTDASGRFRFVFRPDTTAIYLLSAGHGGIEYFSPPVHTNPARPDTAMAVIVFDTSSRAPVRVESRHIVVPRADESGNRVVLDLIVLRNDGIVARVAPDSEHPSWAGVLPPGIGEFEVGESDISPDAVVQRGDSVLVLAPLAPGDKQLTLEYPLPAGRAEVAFPVGPDSVTVNVLVEEPEVRAAGAALARADSQVIQGRSFRRWSGRMPAGGVVSLTLPRRGSGRNAVAALVAALALGLAFAGWRWLGRARRTAAPPEAGPILDRLAALDARYVGREAEATADEWARYQADRARLKAEAARALAARSARR